MLFLIFALYADCKVFFSAWSINLPFEVTCLLMLMTILSCEWMIQVCDREKMHFVLSGDYVIAASLKISGLMNVLLLWHLSVSLCTWTECALASECLVTLWMIRLACIFLSFHRHSWQMNCFVCQISEFSITFTVFFSTLFPGYCSFSIFWM